MRYSLRFLPWRDPLNLPPYEDRCRLLGIVPLTARWTIDQATFAGKLLMGDIDCYIDIDINHCVRETFCCWSQEIVTLDWMSLSTFLILMLPFLGFVIGGLTAFVLWVWIMFDQQIGVIITEICIGFLFKSMAFCAQFPIFISFKRFHAAALIMMS